MSTEGEDSADEGGDAILVAEFALGVLGADEHARVARRLAAEPALQRELALWQARFAGFDDGFAETPAPPGTYDRITRRLFPAAAPNRAGWWNSLALWRLATGVAALVALLAVGVDLLPRPAPTGAELVAALEAEGSAVKLIAFYDSRANVVRLAALSGAPVAGKDFELWAIKGKNAPVSMGVIPVDAKSNVVVSPKLKGDLGAGTVFAITLEQPGGSPTGAPQGPIVAAGTATAI